MASNLSGPTEKVFFLNGGEECSVNEITIGGKKGETAKLTETQLKELKEVVQEAFDAQGQAFEGGSKDYACTIKVSPRLEPTSEIAKFGAKVTRVNYSAKYYSKLKQIATELIGDQKISPIHLTIQVKTKPKNATQAPIPKPPLPLLPKPNVAGKEAIPPPVKVFQQATGPATKQTSHVRSQPLLNHPIEVAKITAQRPAIDQQQQVKKGPQPPKTAPPQSSQTRPQPPQGTSKKIPVEPQNAKIVNQEPKSSPNSEKIQLKTAANTPAKKRPPPPPPKKGIYYENQLEDLTSLEDQFGVQVLELRKNVQDLAINRKILGRGDLNSKQQAQALNNHLELLMMYQGQIERMWNQQPLIVQSKKEDIDQAVKHLKADVQLFFKRIQENEKSNPNLINEIKIILFGESEEVNHVQQIII